MKRILLLMLGLPGILTNLCAQDNSPSMLADKTFGVSSGFHRLWRFQIDLGKGNHLKLELGSIGVLDHFDNVDSLLLIFLGDVKLLRDSLADPLTVKRIDYLVDAAGRKKIRISQRRHEGIQLSARS